MSLPGSYENDEAMEAILVAVIGVTGSGKSSFIRRITEYNNIVIGDTSESQTETVERYPFKCDGQSYVLIDTPGFNDSKLDDETVFDMLAEWLVNTYRAKQRLNGLIYLLPIIDNRQKGSEIRNLRMFKKLCGEENFGNIMLGLTFCDREEGTVVQARTKELKENPRWWGDMVARGSVIREIPQERDPCLKLLKHFIPKEKVTLRLQSEVVNRGVPIDNTAAAQTVLHHQELAAVRAQEAKEYAEIEKEFASRKQKAAAENEKRMAEDGQNHEKMDNLLGQQKEEMLTLQTQESQELEREELAQVEETRKSEQHSLQCRQNLEKAKRQVDLQPEVQKQRQELEDHVEKIRSFRIDIKSCLKSLTDWASNGRVKTAKLASHKNLTGFCDRCLTTLFPRKGQYYSKDYPNLKGTEEHD
ncbi:hypothetical protein MMC17_009684 [Xylographa soralifera]|nr:hypothetical protein [Xylographa soralifera]